MSLHDGEILQSYHPATTGPMVGKTDRERLLHMADRLLGVLSDLNAFPQLENHFDRQSSNGRFGAYGLVQESVREVLLRLMGNYELVDRVLEVWADCYESAAYCISVVDRCVERRRWERYGCTVTIVARDEDVQRFGFNKSWTREYWGISPRDAVDDLKGILVDWRDEPVTFERVVVKQIR